MVNETRRFLEIPSLDGLRAVSIAIVFVAHIGLEDVVPGGLGVTVFFVLSGYLITTLLRLEQEKSGRCSLKKFYVRRFFRILPLFYGVLGLAVVATFLGLGSGKLVWSGVVAQASHITNYWGLSHSYQYIPGTPVYWSLAVEEHFYVVFPLLFVVLAWRFVLVYGMHSITDRTYYGSDTRLDSLLFGCAAALVANPVVDGPRQSKRALTGWFLAAAVTVLATLVVRDNGFRESLRYTVQSVAIVAILRYVVSEPSSPVGRLLNTRPMVWLGRLSYPFYLVHFIVILEVKQHVTSLPAIALFSLGLAIPLAWAVRELLDRPAQRVRDRVLARLAQPTPAVAATVNAGPPVAVVAAASTDSTIDGAATATA